jgi:hypothetical protein
MLMWMHLWRWPCEEEERVLVVGEPLFVVPVGTCLPAGVKVADIYIRHITLRVEINK